MTWVDIGRGREGGGWLMVDDPALNSFVPPVASKTSACSIILCVARTQATYVAAYL